jgi:predicted flap endonuclease-1-like 5' DNA nuclease
MFFLLQCLAPWALAAGALGLVFGLLSGGGTRRPSVLALALALLLGSGVAADAFGFAPGRYGLWLEVGVTIFGSYALGYAIVHALASLLSPRARKTPDWIGLARETLAQAEAFVAAAPAALAANETATAGLAAMAAPPPQAPPLQASPPEMTLREAAALSPEAAPLAAAGASAEDMPAPVAADALAAIVGLDSRSARELRAQGVNDLESMADLTPEGRKAAAERLGLDEATIDFWSAQARLYAHGVARPPSSAAAETRPDAASAPPIHDDPPRSDASRALDALYPGERPPGSPVAPESGADDLTRIAGIDAVSARRLHGLGIWTFAQIAGWTTDQARWVEFYLAEPGRAGREHWREQAARLADGALAAPRPA